MEEVWAIIVAQASYTSWYSRLRNHLESLPSRTPAPFVPPLLRVELLPVIMNGMSTIAWPATILLSVLLVCTSALVWKGLVPIHAFFAVGGAVLGYVVPKAMPLFGRKFRAEDVFPPEEIPTKKDLSEFAQTRAMVAKRREDLR